METTMPASPARRLLLLIAFLIVVGVLVGGAYFLYIRGTQREGMFERAVRLYREGDLAGSEALARELLRANSRSPEARGLLVELLRAAGRRNEAESTARGWLAENPDDPHAMNVLVDLLLERGEFGEVRRIAWEIVDRRPDYALDLLQMIEAAHVDVEHWLQAASYAVSKATVTRSAAQRAEALLFAGATRLDAARFFRPRDAAVLEEQARRDLEAALRAAKEALSEREPLAELLQWRIGCLSADETEASVAVNRLQDALGAPASAAIARASMAHYHTLRGEFSEAAAHVREMANGPRNLWFRAVHRLAAAGARQEAIALLGAAEGEESAFFVQLLRLGLLLRGEAPDEKAAGRAIAESLLPRIREDAVAVEMLARTVAASGELELALRILDAARVGNAEWRLDLVAAALGASERGAAESLALAEELARRLDTYAESVLAIRGLLEGAGVEAALRFLDAKVAEGGESGVAHRVERARLRFLRSVVGRETDPEASARLRAEAAEDLRAAAADPDATTAVLARASMFAQALNDFETAGRCFARALARPGDAGPVPLIYPVLATPFRSEAEADAYRRGVEAAAAQSPVRALVLAVGAHAGRSRVDAGRVVADLEAAASDPASRTMALEIAAWTALALGRDPVASERLARAALESADSEAARARARLAVGEALLRRKAYADVLALHAEPSEARSPEVGRQLAVALRGAGRVEEAIAEARRLRAARPSNAWASWFLADTYARDGRNREALAVLSIAPPSREILLLRADILARAKDYAVAEGIYLDLLRASGDRDLVVWERLRDCMASAGRDAQFLELVSKKLDAKALERSPAARGLLHFQRAITYERLGRAAEAVAEYRAAIGLNPKDFGSLNNLAWLIARTTPHRIEEARALIDRAIEIAPDHPAIRDTSAEVRRVQKEHDAALAEIERAIAVDPQPSYLLRKADILVEMGRAEDGVALLKSIRASHPATPEAQSAAERLLKLERRTNAGEPEEGG
jgi:predicted Zn-dependent protease